MATLEEVQQMLQQALLQQQQHFEGQLLTIRQQADERMTHMMATMTGVPPTAGDRRILDAKKFLPQDIGRFDGKDEHWRVWSTQFMAVIKETDPEIYQVMKGVETALDPIEDADLYLDDGAAEKTAAIYNRLVRLLDGAAFTLHQSVANENGLEVWRLLSQRYNPLTPVRGMQLIMRAIEPGKIRKGEDVQARINAWEGLLDLYERDYKEHLPEGIKIGVLITMIPADLQDIILQHMGTERRREYREVKQQVIRLVDDRMRCMQMRDKGPAPMDIGQVTSRDPWPPEASSFTLTDDYDLAAVGKGVAKGKGGKGKGGKGAARRCFTCGETGHIAAQCKGGNDGKGKAKGKGKAATDQRSCWNCGGKGHVAARCPSWQNRPVYLVEPDDEPSEEDFGKGDTIACWSVETEAEHEQWKTVHAKGFRAGASRRLQASSGASAAHMNRFQCLAPLSEEDEEEEATEISVLEARGAWVKVPATLDSGAAEHVCPRNMLPEIAVQPGGKKRHYVAANGTRIQDEGEKVVPFTTGEGQARKVRFRAAEVMKPLISMVKVVAAGNDVVLDRTNPHIRHRKSGAVTKLGCQNGVYTLDMWVDSGTLGPVFGRPGKQTP